MLVGPPLAATADSILRRVEQFYSQLLTGNCARLKLLYLRMNCASFEEWDRHYPGQVSFVQRHVESLHCLVSIKLGKKIRSRPWTILGGADYRLPLETRRAIHFEYLGKRECCHPFGFARDVYVTLVAPEKHVAIPIGQAESRQPGVSFRASTYRVDICWFAIFGQGPKSGVPQGR